MSADEFRTRRVCYATLDSLLDTRLGCLRRYFPHLCEDDKLKDTLNNYHTRTFEGFAGVTVSDFRKAYLKRDKSVLPYSILTAIKDEIVMFAVHHKKEAINLGEDIVPVLEVNVYPYDITSEQEIEKLKVALRVHTYNELDIEIVNIPTTKLTPKHCRDSYVLMIMYDYSEWFEHCTQKELFQKCPIPQVTLMAPKIWTNDGVDPDAFKAERKGRTIEDTMEVLASVFIGLQLVPIGMFSFIGSTSR